MTHTNNLTEQQATPNAEEIMMRNVLDCFEQGLTTKDSYLNVNVNDIYFNEYTSTKLDLVVINIMRLLAIEIEKAKLEARIDELERLWDMGIEYGIDNRIEELSKLQEEQ